MTTSCHKPYHSVWWWFTISSLWILFWANCRPRSSTLLFHLHLLDTFISSQSLKLGGRRGTTDDVATIPFHLSLSSAALRESPNPIPSCYLPISSSVFLSILLLSLSPAELSLPCQRILRCGHTICTMLRRSSCTPVAFWILLRTSSFVTWSL